MAGFGWNSGNAVAGVEYYRHTRLILALLSGARIVGAVGPPKLSVTRLIGITRWYSV